MIEEARRFLEEVDETGSWEEAGYTVNLSSPCPSIDLYYTDLITGAFATITFHIETGPGSGKICITEAA